MELELLGLNEVTHGECSPRGSTCHLAVAQSIGVTFIWNMGPSAVKMGLRTSYRVFSSSPSFPTCWHITKLHKVSFPFLKNGDHSICSNGKQLAHLHKGPCLGYGLPLLWGLIWSHAAADLGLWSPFLAFVFHLILAPKISFSGDLEFPVVIRSLACRK